MILLCIFSILPSVSAETQFDCTELRSLRGEDVRWKVCDVRWDLSACQELSHFTAESVAVILKQVVIGTSATNEGGSQRREEERVQSAERGRERCTTGWRKTGE